jgi:DNA polymerase-3 subunit epsilon
MKKLFFFDCETTGLNPQHHEICQFASKVFYYDNNEFITPPHSTMHFNIIPDFPENADPHAMAVHQLSIEDLKESGITSFSFYTFLINFLSYHIDKFDPSDKFYPCGFNVDFDYQFLSNFFKRKLDVYFGSWFNHRTFDMLHTSRLLAFCEVPPFNEIENFKLSTCINALPLEKRPLLLAHDALSDINATIELFKYQLSLLNLIKLDWE